MELDRALGRDAGGPSYVPPPPRRRTRRERVRAWFWYRYGWGHRPQ